jgi:hypothetical protein
MAPVRSELVRLWGAAVDSRASEADASERIGRVMGKFKTESMGRRDREALFQARKGFRATAERLEAESVALVRSRVRCLAACKALCRVKASEHLSLMLTKFVEPVVSGSSSVSAELGVAKKVEIRPAGRSGKQVCWISFGGLSLARVTRTEGPYRTVFDAMRAVTVLLEPFVFVLD